jgi:hypothetical protein
MVGPESGIAVGITEGTGVAVGADVLVVLDVAGGCGVALGVSGVADGCDVALGVEAVVGAAGESSACWTTPTAQPNSNG